MKKKLTNEEILKGAIEKAVKNGWDIDPMWEDDLDDEIDRYKNELEAVYRYWIFDHDFAKAFFGKKDNHKIEKIRINGEDTAVAINENWQYHLQQMVLKKEPLKYLENFLDD
jgi:hypothetical protein